MVIFIYKVDQRAKLWPTRGYAVRECVLCDHISVHSFEFVKDDISPPSDYFAANWSLTGWRAPPIEEPQRRNGNTILAGWLLFFLTQGSGSKSCYLPFIHSFIHCHSKLELLHEHLQSPFIEGKKSCWHFDLKPNSGFFFFFKEEKVKWKNLPDE